MDDVCEFDTNIVEFIFWIFAVVELILTRLAFVALIVRMFAVVEFN